MGILKLPLELVLRVADSLQPEDVFNLSQVSKSFAYIQNFTALCKLMLMVSRPETYPLSRAHYTLESRARWTVVVLTSNCRHTLGTPRRLSKHRKMGITPGGFGPS